MAHRGWSPRGIGCPVISALNQVDIALVVTEPTLSGLSDLERVIGLCNTFRVPVAVVINKADLNLSVTEEIEKFCMAQGINIARRITFDPQIPLLLYAKKTPMEGPRG